METIASPVGIDGAQSSASTALQPAGKESSAQQEENQYKQQLQPQQDTTVALTAATDPSQEP